jgi:UDP-N-acetylmuramoyl-tripeptide--D-alanyl-D-alanine ligase
MRKIPLRTLLAALRGETLVQGEDVSPSGVSTDSRDEVRGKMFFALKGEHFDAHDYILDVLRRGACAVVAESSALRAHRDREAIIQCARDTKAALFAAEDSRRALGDAARAALALWRPGDKDALKLDGRMRPGDVGATDSAARSRRLRVIAVTGSSGKTTTRTILHTLISGRYTVRNGIKNYNNDIGLPLTIFSLEEDDEILLLEMGMNHSGELARLAAIARPDLVIITNIGTAHIENLGSREAIAEAKKESLRYLDADSSAVLNKDDPFFDFLSSGISGEVVPFGALPEGFVLVHNQGLYGYMLGCGETEVRFALGGAHNLANLSAAAAAAYKLGLAKSVIAERIALIRPAESRSQVVDGKVRIINDCYNANPESMRAGLSLLGTVRDSRRIAVLADMRELGRDSARLHGELGEWLSLREVCDELITVGPLMGECAQAALQAGFTAASLHVFPSCDEAKAFLPDFVREGDTVLLKGSRAMHLEEVLPFIKTGGFYSERPRMAIREE